jgi:hypothetical protein
MMLVCVEAGQSLDQSIIRVVQGNQARAIPPLARNSRSSRKRSRPARNGSVLQGHSANGRASRYVSSFVTTLVQSATFGTSIAEALRVYAAEMRDKRVMRAEEKANVLPTKLTLGTMLFTVPPLLIILIGPSLYGIANIVGRRVSEVRSVGPSGPRSADAAGRLWQLHGRPWALARAQVTPPGTDRAGSGVDGLTVGHRLMEAGEYELALKAYLRAAAEQGG